MEDLKLTHEERAFIEMVRAVHKGALLGEITAKQALVVSMVKKTKKAGRITIAFDVKPVEDEIVQVTAKVSTKVPEPVQPVVLFYATDDGELQRAQAPESAQTEAAPFRKVGG